MSATVSIEEAQSHLVQIIARLGPGEELVITLGGQPVAKLVGQAPSRKQPRKAGTAKGKLIIHAEDDEHLREFEDYME